MTTLQGRGFRRRRRRPRGRERALVSRPDYATPRDLAPELVTGTAVQLLHPEPAAVAADDELLQPAGLDGRVVLQQLVEHWERIASRYRELATGDTHRGDTPAAAFVSMGGVIYDSCARDLAGLLPLLAQWLPADRGLSPVESSGPDRERTA